jgi:hypothetical protein
VATTPLLEAFDRQVAYCREGAPFTARVLALSRAWLAEDATAHAAFAALTAEPSAGAVPLRWAGALHHLALRGLQPWAGLWPPAEAADDAALAAALRQAWGERRADCDAALALPPQTNEVARSAALLPGLLHVAAQAGLPLRLLEIGSSAGLNLWCDRWRYEHAGWSWGDAASPLTLRSEWLGPPPSLQARLEVHQRAGCDATPINLTQPGEALRLASFIWPDQPERLARLRSAAQAAAAWLAQEGVAVQALPAARFVQQALAEARPGLATVLMHSVVWQYIAPEEQATIRSAVEAAGARASEQAPLAWLRFEPPAGDGRMELRCRLWPTGEDRLLARCHAHGARIEWLPG